MTEEEIKKIKDFKKIEERKSQIAELAKSEDADIDALTKEVEALNVREKELKEIAEKRSKLLNDINAGARILPNQILGEDKASDPDDKEYRAAFMDNILHGTKIPEDVLSNYMEKRENQNTLTTDAQTVIPVQLVNQIIERMDLNGVILPLVTHTSFAGGITIPTSSVKPVATWVGEGKGSDRQKKTTGKISFTYHKLRCEISMSMEVGTMALSAFEAKFAQNVAEAMTIALEKAIIDGNGESMPKGILTETPKETITLKGAEPTYKELVTIESSIPAQFENTAKWCMTKKQFGIFMGITDSNGQPIAGVNKGTDGKLQRNILGREVVIHAYADEMKSHLAFIFNFADYVLNQIYDMGIQKKQDWDTEDYLTKAVASYDGKVIDTESLLVIDPKATV